MSAPEMAYEADFVGPQGQESRAGGVESPAPTLSPAA